MKKKLCLFIVLSLILVGCSQNAEPTTTATTTAEQTTSEKVTTEASYDQLMNAAIVDYPEEAFGSITGLVTGDVNGVFTVSCDINNAGKMAVVADNICKSSLIADGVPLETVSRMLGHIDSKVTKEIYFHVTKKLRNKDNEFLENAKVL